MSNRIAAIDPNTEHPAPAGILATDVYICFNSTEDARNSNTAIQEKLAGNLRGGNKQSAARPKDTGATEQRDMAVLFGSNQDHLDQLPYNNFFDDSSQDHSLAIISDNRDNIGIYPDQRSDIDLDNIGIYPDQRSDIDLAILQTINPTALNI